MKMLHAHWLLYALAALTIPQANAADIVVQTARLRAEFTAGGLSRLTDAAGHELVRHTTSGSAITIHREAGDRSGGANSAGKRLSSGTATIGYEHFGDLSEATAEMHYGVDPQTGDLTLSQKCQTNAQGVWGVSWSIAAIPLDYAIIVPGRSGIRLTADSPGDSHTFDYPISWEAQLVIVEGPGHGFCVWADDAKGRYKRLTVRRQADGWQLQLITINDAPFERLRACQSVTWRLDSYTGDWRVPARRYREWMERTFRPTPLAAQQPGWAKDIRACVIMGLSRETLESLPSRFDPPQTLLYLPDWRAAGYDRDYPTYDALRPELEPFVRRARELGFHVMLHVNYFGVDPLHPLYAKFEPYQVRSAWGKHEKQWWLWERATPVIRFAYINPALRAWRELFVSRMAELCRRVPVDALHLDQTLCIFNDHNGRIDGLSMLEGALALQRELRTALPQVALSGEGLNEATYRDEAFAQRHAWGVNHAEGTWSRPALKCAHPISSYLFLPCTTIYGYLGYVPPEADQMYAAWNEAYEHWGVIPTFRPHRGDLRPAEGFTRQLFDETAFWQRQRVTPALDAEWPAEAAFVFRAANGHTAMRTLDGRLLCGGRTISRTITGVNQATGPGQIPGWRAYDEKRLFGLDPEHWYPCYDEPRDAQAFHVAELPPGVIAAEVFATDDLAIIRTGPVRTTVADLTRLLARAECQSRPFEGPARKVVGRLTGDDGALFIASADQLQAHPPYKGQVVDAKTGKKHTTTGVVTARFEIDLPAEGRLRFLTDIALGKGAAEPGRSDGVTFGVTAQAADRQLQQSRPCLSETPQALELDLTPLAGRRVALELSVAPGPQRNPSFDWARWQRPRIEQDALCEGRLAVAGPTQWTTALSGAETLTLAKESDRQVVRAKLPGSFVLLRSRPSAVALPVDLKKQTRLLVLLSDAGRTIARAPYAGATVAAGTVGGAQRSGLRAHPPDHGRTSVHFPLTLPAEKAVFRSAVGIGDGSTSTGVTFLVEVNGQALVKKSMLPGKWEDVQADLSAWAGKPVVLSLVTDSDGSFSCDWAFWAQPRLER